MRPLIAWRLRPTALAVALLIVPIGSVVSINANAQDTQRSARDGRIANYDDANAFRAERSVIEDLLQTLVGLVKDATLAAPDEIATDRLFALSDRLSGAKPAIARATSPDPAGARTLRADELEQAMNLLRDLVDQSADVRQELRIEGQTELADKMRDVENGLLDALALLKKVEVNQVRSEQPMNQADRWDDRADDRADNRTSDDTADGERSARDDWYTWAERWKERRSRDRDGRTDDDRWNDGRRNDNRWDDDQSGEDGRHDDRWDNRTDSAADDDDEWRNRSWRHRNWDNGYDPETLIGVHVGEFGYGWPYRETGAYRSIPAIRYNRVDGLVLGIRRLPLSWDSWERARLYGHGGYAFGDKSWQYEVGAEARTGNRSGSSLDFKAGASYRRTTATEDLWKSSWVENTLAAFFFNYDFLDYFRVEGFTTYASARLTPRLQVTGAYRQEKYSSLENEVHWTLFGGRDFRINPPIDAGDMNSVLVAVEGGSVSDLDWLPRGAAFRFEAEFGRDFGGDFDFNRYLGDARVYLPMSHRSTLSLRVRGGTSDGSLPLQKLFTLGGIGSTRSYAQNTLVGTRMLLGNVEYAINQDWLWDDILIAGFVDAGWVNNAESNKFDFDDIYPAVGAGIGLLDRSLRLEVSFPLRDIGGTREPSIWLRVNPSF